MKVNFENNIKTREEQGRTFIAANLKKETVRLDRFGNEIDPRTKQIINQADKSNE